MWIDTDMGRKSKGEGSCEKNNIDALRLKAGFTQTELAERAGISRSTLNRMILARRPSKLDDLVKVAKALDVSVNQLVNRGSSSTVPVTVASQTIAGVWQQVVEWPSGERFDVTIPESASYVGVRRRGSRVGGASMNQVYPDGSVVVWVPFKEINEPLIPGRRYILNRVRKDGTIEHTVKTYTRDRDGKDFFYGETDDPAFQEPIAYVDTPEYRIEVVGRVTDSIRHGD